MADPIQISETSNKPSTRLDRADWGSFGATTFLALLGYLITLTPEVTLENSGTLTTGAMYGGVGFPAGYPVWTIYSWLFIKLLPFGNPAWRVAVGSAVAGAVSCGLVALMISRSGKIMFNDLPAFQRLTSFERNSISGISGYAAGLALAFSDSLWNEALIADYFTFTVLFFTSILYLLMRWLETGCRRFCCAAFLSFGLLLTNSQEMIVALPGMVIAILCIDRPLGRDVAFLVIPAAALVTSLTQYGIWNSDFQFIDWQLFIALLFPMILATVFTITTRKFGTEWKAALACAVLLLLGFGTYLYLPIASATNPPVNWGYARTLEGFVHLISRGQFEHVSPTNSLAILATQLWATAKQTTTEFGWVYIPFAALPFLLLPKMTASGKKWMITSFLISMCVGPLLEELLNFATDRQSQEMAEAYFYPLHVPLTLWVGMGMLLFGTKMATLGRAKKSVPGRA